MRLVAGLIVLTVIHGTTAEAGSVKGRIILRTEENTPIQRFIPGRHRILYMSSDVPNQACGQTIVTNTLEIATLAIKPPCSGEHLQAELMLQPNDLSLRQEPRPMQLPACKDELCEYELVVKWPRTKTREQREAYYQKGMATYSSDTEAGLAYFAEASWGSVEYTETTAAHLEKDRRFQDLWMFIDSIEAGLFDADHATRSRVLVQKASAASAAGHPVVALEAAAEALRLTPSDQSAVAIARQTLISMAPDKGAKGVAIAIEANPEIKKAFEKLYLVWTTRGGPSSTSEKVAFMLDPVGPAQDSPWSPDLLARLVGDWEFTNKSWMQPGQPAMESTGTMHAEPLMDGRYVAHQWKASMMGMPFEGHGTDGYDAKTKQYTSSWIDNMGTGIMIQRGTCDASGKRCTLVGETADPMTGQKSTLKSVVTWIDHDTFKNEMYGKDSTGKEVKLGEITAKRKKRLDTPANPRDEDRQPKP